ncbi:MAG: hypothetical protein HQ477_11530 [Chloroflexi bacterium]|nr:hypothetical protein [Chloroflexota bacterium]
MSYRHWLSVPVASMFQRKFDGISSPTRARLKSPNSQLKYKDWSGIQIGLKAE